MFPCYPATPKRLAMTVAGVLVSISGMGYALHLSYVNIAPQQARIQARNEYIRHRLKKIRGDPEE